METNASAEFTFLLLNQAEWSAIRLTICVSMAAVVCSLPLAIGLAWLLARYRFPGKRLLEIVLHLPLVLPPVVTGYLLLLLFGRRGPIGACLEQWFGIHLVFDWKGAVLAAGIVGFPLLLRPIRMAFQRLDPRLLQAARSLGASPWDAFWSVALPLARTGLVSGALLAFARSMGEFGATIMIAGNIPGETQTMSLLLYALVDAPNGMSHAWRLVLASIVIASVALACHEYLDQDEHRTPSERATRT